MNKPSARDRFTSWWKGLTGDVRLGILWLAILVVVGSIWAFLPAPGNGPASTRTPGSDGQNIEAWLTVALFWVIELMSKAAFWICLCLLWAATIIASSIDKGARLVGRRLELLARRFRKRPRSEDEIEEDDFFDDDL